MSKNDNQNPQPQAGSELNNSTANGPDVAGGVKNAAGSAASAAGRKISQKGIEKLKKQIAKKAGKEVAKVGAKMSLGAPLAAILLKVFIVLICIILLIGIIMFIVTMPGMLMDKLKNLAKGIANAWLAWWGGDSTKQVEQEDIYEVLEYIADMGFDLKGYGFLTDYVHNSEELDGFFERTGLDEGDYEDRVNQEEDGDPIFDESNGVVRNAASNKIILASSDFVNAYLVSENYIYTIKNFNQKDIGAWTGFWDRLGSLFSDSMKNRTGMLFFVHEGGEGIGFASDDVYDSFERGYIEADASSKTLEIKKGWANGKMKFSLDGWTGRYGMPVDFLVAIQTATFMPDLAYDMTENFKTEIKIILHDSSGPIVGQYKNLNGKYITYEQISQAVNGVSGRNWFSQAVSWFDELVMTVEEANRMLELGVIPDSYESPDCECEVKESKVVVKDNNTYVVYSKTIKGTNGNEETVYYYITYDSNGNLVENIVSKPDELPTQTTLTKVCDTCKEFLRAVVEYTRKANDYSFETYTPYIEKVTDHWYRDVYFVKRASKDIEFVDYNYDYEAMMKERWTLYEKYTAEDSAKGTYKYNPERAGQEILLLIDEEGEYKKEGGKFVAFDGTIEDARPSKLYEKDGEKYVETDKKLSQAQDEGTTLYRKSSKGDFVVYTGDVAVSKKAVTIDISEKYDDLSWNELSDGSYSAYSPEEEQMSDMQKPFKSGDETYDEGNDLEKTVMDRIYAEVKIGVVKQTGEGQRTETNPKIKKMFLQNNYFRYDGSAETAEIITELRKKINEDRKNKDSEALRYGALTDDEMEKEYTITYGYEDTKKENQQVKVRDYAGKLEVLTQDSLSAFSMLENTHTLDADYIYRDFKELIVELGYFEKEQLTDETPRLLQFPVPEIGSAEYPARSIDKRVQEKGTMIHSKYDIDTNKKYILEDVLKDVTKTGGAEEPDQLAISEENRFSNTTLASSRVNNNRLQLTSKSINITEVGAIKGASKKPEQVPLQKFLKETETMCKYMDQVGYNYCVRRRPCDCTTCSPECKEGWEEYLKCVCDCSEVHCSHTIHRRSDCGLQGTFEQSKSSPTSKYDTCCNYLVRWAFQNVGITEIDNHYAIENMYNWFIDELNGKEIPVGEQMKPGDILFYDSKDGRPFAHVDGILEANGSSYTLFNGGSVVEIGATKGQKGSSMPPYSGREIAHIVRLNWGNSKDGMYEGFEGNEAVVSPVTGVLVDYGTYNREDDQKRENIDLKYGPSVRITVDEETGEITDVTTDPVTNPPDAAATKDENEEYEPVYDEVGYAVIRVMTKEDFEKLESSIESYWARQGDKEGLLNNAGEFRDELTKESQLEQLLNSPNGYLDETIYGYKEFAEMYSTYGIYVNSKPVDEDDTDTDEREVVRKLISGYTIFIDGFKCELPDEAFIDTNGDESVADEEGFPDGEDLTMDSFKIDPSKINDNNELIQNFYEPAKEYKLASKSATERLNVEELTKIDAYGAMVVDDIIYIKEGTVIGRTYTDREVVEKLREDRNEKVEDYKISSTKTETELNAEDYKFEDKLIGNYLRIIMQEEANTTPVENVENYMKLDELERKSEIDWEFYYWLPYESGPIGEQEPGTYTGAGSCGTVSGASEVACGFAQWTTLDGTGTNNIPALCEWLAEKEPGLCASLAAFSNYSASQICDDLESLKTAWYTVYDSNPERFLELQMEYFYEENYLVFLEQYGTEWMQDKSSVAQGTYASLLNWGPNLGWEDVIDPSMSDEEIVKALLQKARPINSTCGTLEDRWDSQYVLACDILSGAFTEVEEWVKTKLPLKYENGRNPGALLAWLNDNIMFYANTRRNILGGTDEK